MQAQQRMLQEKALLAPPVAQFVGCADPVRARILKTLCAAPMPPPLPSTHSIADAPWAYHPDCLPPHAVHFSGDRQVRGRTLAAQAGKKQSAPTAVARQSPDVRGHALGASAARVSPPVWVGTTHQSQRPIAASQHTTD